jgi:signal transduction histidine kinase
MIKIHNIEASRAFLTGAGEVSALLRGHDWSTSPLGDPDGWPTSLRTVVSLLLHSKFPMFVAWGADLGFLYNDAYIEVLGDKHPSALGRPFQEIWAEIWGDICPLIDRALAGEASYHENLPLTMRRNGFDEQTWFTFSYSPVHDENHAVAGVYCACTETTGQVLAERHRGEENERLRGLFDQAPGIMAVFRGAEHTFELANAAYLRLAGERELIGKPIRSALPELEGQGFFELLDRAYGTGKAYLGRAVPVRLQRTQHCALEERFVDFIYQPIRDANGKVNGIFLEGSDVTDAVRTSAALRSSEERLRVGLSAARMVVWDWDFATGSVKLSDNAAQVFGRNWHTIDAGWEMMHPDDAPLLRRALTLAIEKCGEYDLTARMIRPDSGATIWVQMKGAVHCDGAGRPRSIAGVALDVSARRHAEEEVHSANRRKDEFLAMLAHELRNPLAPISTAAQLLKFTGLDEKRIRQTSDIISRQVEHMTALVDDLLDVSRVTSGLVNLKMEICDVSRIVADAIEQVRPIIEARHQQLTLTVPDAPAFVQGDRKRLVQIFANIIKNAAKYTPENGMVAVLVASLRDQVACTVRDNGTGIAASLLPHIFNLFTQAERSPDRSQGGLGLGLALVKSLVESHRGTVSAHSDGPGTGSEFTVLLPRWDGPCLQPEQVATDISTVRPRHALRLLVVDDNVDAVTVLALLLQKAGHTVAVEYDALATLERVRFHAPQVIFLDIGLPGMDGYELAKRLRQMPETDRAILIALTGYGQPQDRERSKSSGFDYHLVKPVSAAEIFTLLDNCLD